MIIKIRVDEISFTKMGCVYRLVVLKYMHSFHQTVVTYLSITGRLVRVLSGLGVAAFFVGSGRGGWVT
jgi:hypothetical protein